MDDRTGCRPPINCLGASSNRRCSEESSCPIRPGSTSNPYIKCASRLGPDSPGAWGVSRICFLGENELTGPVPDALASLTSLRRLDLSRSELTGPVPTLNALTESLMQDVRRDGIRVSCVLPGSVNTEFGDGRRSADADWKLDASDVARAVVDLLRHPARSLPSRVEPRPSVPRT